MTNAQSFSTPTSYPSVENPNYAVAADFDADGKIDLATANALTNSVTFAFNNGTGSFPSRISYNSDSNPGWVAPEPLAVADFNGDGKPDVAVGNFSGGPLSRVRDTATWFTSEPNTRVILFALNLQLNSGESPSVVKVTLLDGNGQTRELAAEDVRTIANTTFTQVTFRLPDALARGTCLVTIKAHERISNSGTFRIVQ